MKKYKWIWLLLLTASLLISLYVFNIRRIHKKEFERLDSMLWPSGENAVTAVPETFGLSLATTLQETVKIDGTTQVKPLIIIPCDLATAPRVFPANAASPHEDKSRADFFLVLKNCSSTPAHLIFRNPWKIIITLHTDDSSPQGGGNHPKDFTYQLKTSTSGPFQYLYTLASKSERIEKINLFDIPEMTSKPLDWYVAMGISRIKVDYYIEIQDIGIQCVSTGWTPITARSLP